MHHPRQTSSSPCCSYFMRFVLNYTFHSHSDFVFKIKFNLLWSAPLDDGHFLWISQFRCKIWKLGLVGQKAQSSHQNIWKWQSNGSFVFLIIWQDMTSKISHLLGKRPNFRGHLPLFLQLLEPVCCVCLVKLSRSSDKYL